MIYLADYNRLGFDKTWLAHRFTIHGLQDIFLNIFGMQQSNNNLLQIMNMYVKSAMVGKGKHGSRDEGTSIRTKHFAHIDFMHYVATRGIYDKRKGKSIMDWAKSWKSSTGAFP